MVLSASEQLAHVIELCLDRAEAVHADHSPEHRPTFLVVIDGPAGAGKTTLSHQLAPHLTWHDANGYRHEAVVVHLDDMYEGWEDGPAGGAECVGKQVIAPISAGKPGSYRRYDWAEGRFAERHEVAPVPFLVVEGSGAGAGLRHAPTQPAVLIWLDADDEERVNRVLARDGEHLRAELERWIEAERAHFTADGTRDRADVVLRRDATHGQWVPA